MLLNIKKIQYVCMLLMSLCYLSDTHSMLFDFKEPLFLHYGSLENKAEIKDYMSNHVLSLIQDKAKELYIRRQRRFAQEKKERDKNRKLLEAKKQILRKRYKAEKQKYINKKLTNLTKDAAKKKIRNRETTKDAKGILHLALVKIQSSNRKRSASQPPAWANRQIPDFSEMNRSMVEKLHITEEEIKTIIDKKYTLGKKMVMLGLKNPQKSLDLIESPDDLKHISPDSLSTIIYTLRKKDEPKRKKIIPRNTQKEQNCKAVKLEETN